jgi:hypothetical protein
MTLWVDPIRSQVSHDQYLDALGLSANMAKPALRVASAPVTRGVTYEKGYPIGDELHA